MTTTALWANPVGWLLDRQDADEVVWDACGVCGLPAVCFGADLADPTFLCGQCCPTHEGNNPTLAHCDAEGIATYDSSAYQ